MKKKKKNENSSKIFERHDHGACFDDAIAQIEDYFIEKKLRLTPLRRKVFEILIGPLAIIFGFIGAFAFFLNTGLFLFLETFFLSLIPVT